MLKADLRLQSIHYPRWRTRPTGMLKPQLTLLLQFNRCPDRAVCYKNENRVTPTRPYGLTNAATRHHQTFSRYFQDCASGSPGERWISL